MALLSGMFDQGQYGGLLADLQRMFAQPQQAQAAFNTPQSLPTEPAFDMGISNYGGMQTPVFGQPPAPQEVSSQSRMPQQAMPQQPMQAPQQPVTFGDRVNAYGDGARAGAERMGGVGAMIGGISGFLTGDGGNVTLKALKARGVDENLARAAMKHPQIMSAVLQQVMGTKNGVIINGRLVNPATGQLIADYSDTNTKAPDTKEFEGPDGGKVVKQWNASTKTWDTIPVEGGGKGKPPAGYTWGKDGGLDPIPRGPATQLPAETAGRLALVEAALPKFREARKLFEKDWGPVEYAQYSFDTGDIGRAKLSVRTAIEAALRTATGAAAPEPEVQRYLDMYMPKDVDSKTTAKQKLDALESFMVKSKELVTQGRSAPQSPQRIKINANGQVIP
jgi:hypothetical protein